MFLLGPEKRHIPHKVVDSGNGVFRIEFTTVEVGSYVIDVTVTGLSVPNSPLIAKSYDASLIKVTDITDGVVGDLSTFRGNKYFCARLLWIYKHPVPLHPFIFTGFYSIIFHFS